MSFTINFNDSKALDLIEREFIRAGKIAAEDILRESKAEIPHEHGALERSGTVVVKNKEIYITYNEPYARRQHEDLDLSHPAKDAKNHPRSKAGRKAKFLEDPFNRLKNKASQFISLSIKLKLRNS